MTAPVVVVLHGPSLNLLGTREPDVYGTLTLAALDALVAERAAALGLAVRALQSNHEGALIDALHEAHRDGAAGVVLNAGAYAHTSLALADAVRAVAPRLPVIEVHLTNTVARGRVEAPVGASCAGRIEGLGAHGYLLAIEAIDRLRARP